MHKEKKCGKSTHGSSRGTAPKDKIGKNAEETTAMCSKNSRTSRIQEMYDCEDSDQLLVSFIESATKEEVCAEVEYLASLVDTGNFGLEAAVLICEVLARCRYNYPLVKVVYEMLERKKEHKYSVFKLRLLNCLHDIGSRRFIPISTYLIEILRDSLRPAKGTPEKQFTMEHLKVSSDSISEEFNMLVSKKALRILFKHLDNFSNSIAFPEFAFFVVKELKGLRKSREIEGLVGRIEEHANRVERARKKLGGGFDNKKLADFEGGIKKMTEGT